MRERERDKGREKEKEKQEEKKGERENFFKGMTGPLVPFSYLVSYSIILHKAGKIS
jgi:hypothetical protein